jgi:hypothetical protein
VTKGWVAAGLPRRLRDLGNDRIGERNQIQVRVLGVSAGGVVQVVRKIRCQWCWIQEVLLIRPKTK